LLNWFRNLGIWAILGTMLAAAMLVLRAYQSGKIEVQNEHDEGRIKKLGKEQEADIKEAARLQGNIAKRNLKANDIEEKSEASARRIGQDESASDMLTRFDNGLVRSRAIPIAPVRSRKKARHKGKRSN